MNSTAEQWQRFIAGEPVGPIRPEILASWYRSRDFGVDPNTRLAPAAADDRPGRRLDEDLVVAELAALARGLEPEAVAIEAISAVCDAGGRILYAGGSPSTLRCGRANALAPAFGWAEQDIGTNGLGLALRSAEPIVVEEAEHWRAALHAWSGAAVAIRDPVTEEPLGVLGFCRHGAALPARVPTVLRRATRDVQAAVQARADAILDELRSVFAEQEPAHTGALALADRSGRLVACNNELFGAPDSALLRRGREPPCAPAVPALRGLLSEAVRRGRADPFWVGSATVYVPALRAELLVTVQPIRIRSAVAGILLTTDGASGERFGSTTESPRERILGVHDNWVVVLSPQEIRFAEADGNTVWLDTDRGRLPACERGLSALQRRLEEHGFARVHRNFLVNLERVQEIAPNYHGRFWLRVDSQRLGLVPVARRHVPQIRALLGL